jgi:hypothetical protein
MSQENVEIVRHPLAISDRSHRRLEERLAVRFPRVLAFLVRAAWRLPHRSRLRGALLRRAVETAGRA